MPRPKLLGRESPPSGSSWSARQPLEWSFAMSRARTSLRSRPDGWKIGLILNKHGVPFGNLRNVLHALHNAPEWKGVLAYDEFAETVITRRSPPWSDRTIEQWADDHDTRACVWFQDQGIPVTVGVVGRGIQTIAR